MDQDKAPYLERLRALPHVLSVEVTEHPNRALDGSVAIGTRFASHDFPLAVLDERMPAEKVRGWANHAQQVPNLLLFVPYVSYEVALQIAQTRLNFVDIAGNCIVHFGTERSVLALGWPPSYPIG